MPSTLLNHYTDADEYVNFYEYQISFTNEPIPGEQILVGFDYSNRNIIAELRGEQIVVGIMPYTDPGTPFRLILTVEAQVEVLGGNVSYIPYEVYFNFSETTNEYTQTLINPFIKSIDRPYIDAIHDSVIYDDTYFSVEYFTDALFNVSIEIYKVNNEHFNLVYYDYNAPISNILTLTNFLEVDEYLIKIQAFNDPLMSTIYENTFLVEGVDKTVNLTNYINNNTIFDIYASQDLLPIITFTNIIIINSSTVQFNYQTLNANYVELITSFGQDYINIQPNGFITFNNLTVNTLYEITIIARDTNSNFDTRDLNFTIIVNIVNNTKGILGLKRGKEL